MKNRPGPWEVRCYSLKISRRDAIRIAVLREQLCVERRKLGICRRRQGNELLVEVVRRGLDALACGWHPPAEVPAVAPLQPRAPLKGAIAEELLLRELAAGPQESRVLQHLAGVAGISTTTLDRARRKLGVRVERRSLGRLGSASVWRLPTNHNTAATPVEESTHAAS